ncbi:MAG: cytochrome c [Verrucomicrobiaceae bacterium]|nr:MAG: cytochrome c [Verrucomicrobiaceae bacterium]
MLRYFFVIFAVVTIGVIALAGFRGEKMTHPPLEILPDMDHQPRYNPQAPSEFFADHRASRQPVAGTVPMGYTIPNSYWQIGADDQSALSSFAKHPDYYNTGKLGDVYGDGIPVEVTERLMQRGQERFDINCAICHDQAGTGNGIIKSYGLTTIASLQDDRLRTSPDGYLFSVVTNGKNTMGAYGPQISIEDRWAIVAYLRALQKSQGVKVADLPQAKQQELNSKQ